MKIPSNKISALSFSDFDVISMNIQFEAKELVIETEGVIISENDSKPLGKGLISFKNWENIFIMEFNAKKWIETQDLLRDICEFTYEKKICVLKGFGKNTGNWIEYNITGATIEAFFDPYI